MSGQLLAASTLSPGGRKMTQRLVKITLVGAVALGAASAANAADIKLMTGPQGGSWYPLGGAIKNIVETKVADTSVQVLPGAGIANVKAVQAGKADFGFANSVSTVDAINGNPPFDAKATNVCNVATLYPQYFQVVADGGAGIKTAADFKGKALTTQKKGNTGEAITEHLLKAYGMSYDDMSRVSYGSYTDSVNQMKDGNAQVFTLGTTVPAGAIMDLASARKIMLVPIPDDGLAKMKAINPGYPRIMVPAGSYPGQDAEVATIGYSTHIIARCDLDAALVYDVLTNIAASVPDLASVAKAVGKATPKSMAVETGVPLHQGAERFYKEKGVL
jgi:TRAP transporter TAXI family solute receptor